MRRYLIALARVVSATALLIVILWAGNFPYNTDAPPTSVELAAARKYYTEIYKKPVDGPAPAETDYDRKYQETAEQAAKRARSSSAFQNLWNTSI